MVSKVLDTETYLHQVLNLETLTCKLKNCSKEPEEVGGEIIRGEAHNKGPQYWHPLLSATASFRNGINELELMQIGIISYLHILFNILTIIYITDSNEPLQVQEKSLDAVQKEYSDLAQQVDPQGKKLVGPVQEVSLHYLQNCSQTHEMMSNTTAASELVTVSATTVTNNAVITDNPTTMTNMPASATAKEVPQWQASM
jgi:hypothetical protein